MTNRQLTKILVFAHGKNGRDFLAALAALKDIKLSVLAPDATKEITALASGLGAKLLKNVPARPDFDILINAAPAAKRKQWETLLARCPETVETINAKTARLFLSAPGKKEDCTEKNFIYRMIVEHLPLGLFLKDAKSRYLFADKKLARVCGQPQSRFMDGSLSDKDIFAPHYARKYISDDKRVLESGTTAITEPFPIKENNIIVKTIKTPVKDKTGKVIGVMGIFQDITEQENIRKILEYRTKLKKLITAISTSFINLPVNAMDNGIHSALKKIGDFCKADRAYVCIFPDKDKDESRYEWCAKGVKSPPNILNNLDAKTSPTALRTLRNKKIFRLPNQNGKLTAAEKKKYRKTGVKTLIHVPMISNGRLIGFLGFDSPKEDMLWNEDVIALLRTAGEIFTQILLQQKIALALRKEKEFVEGIIDTANVIILLLDNNRKIIRFNKYMEKLTGWTSAEMAGRDWFSNFIPENISQDIKRLFKKAITDTPTKGNVNPIKTKSGKLRYIEWSDTTLKDAHGNTEGLLSIGHDITERVNAEKALIESEKKLRLFAESSADVIWTMAPEGKYTYISPSCRHLLGYCPKEIMALSSDSVRKSEQFRTAVAPLLKQTAKPLPPIRMEIQQTRRDSVRIWTEIVASQSRDENGTVIGVSGITRDITDRKQATAKLNEYRFHLEELVKNKTKQLRESNEFNSSIIENIPSSIMVLDKHFNIATSNPRLSKLFQTHNNLNGQPLQSIIRCYKEPDYKRLFVTLNKVLQGKLSSAEIELTLPINKITRSLRFHVSCMLPRREKLLVVIEDISQHKTLEQHLLFAERLAATGRLAASFAHEINNPLQGMATHLDILFEDKQTSHEDKESYKCIRENINRIARIVKQLMHTKNTDQQEFDTLCIDDLVNKVVSLMENNLRVKGIDLKYSPKIKHILVHGSETQLHQAILNLVINAMDNMEKGGELTIRVSTDAHNAHVEIRDTGKGIRPKDIEHIFDPFFTKKKTGGSGLGLFVSQNIALMHNGNISVKSKFGKGSTFILSIPLKVSTPHETDSLGYLSNINPRGEMPDFLD